MDGQTSSTSKLATPRCLLWTEKGLKNNCIIVFIIMRFYANINNGEHKKREHRIDFREDSWGDGHKNVQKNYLPTMKKELFRHKNLPNCWNRNKLINSWYYKPIIHHLGGDIGSGTFTCGTQWHSNMCIQFFGHGKPDVRENFCASPCHRKLERENLKEWPSFSVLQGIKKIFKFMGNPQHTQSCYESWIFFHVFLIQMLVTSEESWRTLASGWILYVHKTSRLASVVPAFTFKKRWPHLVWAWRERAGQTWDRKWLIRI